MTEAEWLASEYPAALLDYLTHETTSPNGFAVLHSRRDVPLASDRKLRLFACALWLSVGDRLATSDRIAYERLVRFVDSGDSADLKHSWSLPLLSPLEFAENSIRGFVGKNWRGSPAVAAALLRDIVGNPFRPVVTSRLYLLDPVANAIVAAAGHAACEEVPRAAASYDGRYWTAVRAMIVRDHWLTADVRAMARKAYDGHDFAALPIIADAMEEAGCGLVYPCPRCEGKPLMYQVGSTRGMPDFRAVRCSICNSTGRVEKVHPLIEHLRSPGPHARGCWVLDLILGIDPLTQRFTQREAEVKRYWRERSPVG
jgi:hypothetical protein